MNNKLTVHKLIDKILSDLRQEKYADYTIGSYRHCYNGLVKFIEQKKSVCYSDALGIEYIQQKFGISINGLFDQCPANVHSSIRALKLLSGYSQHGVVVKRRKFGGKPFECPDVFSKDYELFKCACKSRNYAPMGEASLFWSLHKFLVFMNEEGAYHFFANDKHPHTEVFDIPKRAQLQAHCHNNFQASKLSLVSLSGRYY